VTVKPSETTTFSSLSGRKYHQYRLAEDMARFGSLGAWVEVKREPRFRGAGVWPKVTALKRERSPPLTRRYGACLASTHD
jgi:hypothetical protein